MQRNKVLDLAKSWAIFSVVVFHVVTSIVSWEGMASFINTYFLTLFFFVSGLLVKDAKLSQNWCWKQVTHLLVPFLSCWLLYRLFFYGLRGTSILSKGAIDDAKGGYWFILVLFMFNLMLYGLRMITRRIPSKTVHLALLTLPFWGAVFLCVLLPYDVAGYLSLMSVRRYWLFFAYGYSINNIWHCEDLLKDKRLGILSCCVYLPMAVFYVMEIVSVKSSFDFAFWTLTNIVAIHSLLYIFHTLQEKLCNKYILNVGMNTLGIYVFHYYPLQFICMIMGGAKHSIENSWWLLIFMVVIYSLIILVVAYWMTSIVKRISPLSRLVLGCN